MESLEVSAREPLSARTQFILLVGVVATVAYLSAGVAYAMSTTVNLAGDPWLVALVSFGLEVAAWPVMMGLR